MKILSPLLCVLLWCTAEAQSIDPVSMLLAKAIKTLDLKVQRLQNETLVLQRLQQVAEQELAKVKLDEIRNWQEQLSALYVGYFAELKEVKPVISSGAMVKSILALEEHVLSEYRKFPNKTEHTEVFHHSKALRRMLAIVLSNQLSMKDVERLQMLYTLRDAMSRCLERIQSLNQQELLLEAKRMRLQRDAKDVKRLHGIQ